MPKFDYSSATTIEEAVRLLNETGKRSIPLAGGTDIYVAIRIQPVWFDRLVDVSSIPGMRLISIEGDQMIVGASVTFTQAERSALLQQKVPFLVEACGSIGGPAIRNQGTLGGNVSNAAACADSLPSLVCLDAVAHLLSPKGERQMKVSDLIVEPHKTKIEPGELLTHFSFPLPPEKARSRFIKIGRRKAQSISRLSLGAIGSLDGSGKVDYIRITPGAAVATAVRFEGVEKMILGETPTQALFVEAGEKMAADMISQTGRRWSTPYKEIAIKAITERALKTIFEQE